MPDGDDERQRKDRSGYVPTLSRDERDRRWGLVRERMVQRNVDALLVWGTDRQWGMGRANLRYLTQVPGQEVAIGLFPLRGEPTVWADVPHRFQPYEAYGTYQDWVTDVRVFEGVPPIVEELEARGLDGGTLGLVGFASMLSRLDVPHVHYRALESSLPRATLLEATDLVEGVRLIKSDEEIELLRRSGEIARGMAAALMEAEPGRRECEVYADMVHEQIASGGEAYVFCMMDSGAPTDADREHLLHAKSQPLAPSHRRLAEGDLLITEFHGNYGGYLTAAEKSVVLGEPPAELRAVHDVCLRVQERAMDLFRPGNRLEDVWEGMRRPVREADMSFVELGFHGHGLGSPELPTSVYSTAGTHAYPEGMADHLLSGAGLEDVRLREGMVFGTNIDVYDPSWRTDVGLMYGDCLLVTDGGPEKLVDTPTDLVV